MQMSATNWRVSNVEHKTLTLTMIIALLGGCVTSTPTKHAPVQPVAPQIIAVDISVAMPPRSFVHPKQSPQGIEYPGWVGRQRLFESLKYSLFNGKYDGDLKLDNVDGVFYVVATWPKKQGAEYGPVSARFGLTTTVGADAFTYTLECPSQLSITVEKPGAIGLSDTQPLARRLNEACRAAHMRFDSQQQFHGEINSQFSEVAVFENYKRCLAKGSAGMTLVKADDSQRGLTFTDAHRNFVTIVISPYRNGSKVAYNFLYQYEGDETTGKFKYSQADVDATKKAIADFAND
jgi:hypothetical protein